METTAYAAGVLNDLIEFNKDRVAGFEKTIADIKGENIDSAAVSAPATEINNAHDQVKALRDAAKL